MEDRKIGEIIRNLRILRGVEQGDLARRAGVSQSLVSKVESGVANPSLETIKSIADSLGVTYEELFAPRKLVPLSDKIIMGHLDENLRQFIAKDDSEPYIEVARELYEKGFNANELEALRMILASRK